MTFPGVMSDYRFLLSAYRPGTFENALFKIDSFFVFFIVCYVSFDCEQLRGDNCMLLAHRP